MDRQGLPQLDLWVERGTARTPEPTKYYVFHGEVIVAEFKHLKRALARYDELKHKLGYKPPEPESLSEEERSRIRARESQDERLLRQELFWVHGDRYQRDGRRR